MNKKPVSQQPASVGSSQSIRPIAPCIPRKTKRRGTSKGVIHVRAHMGPDVY